jgi:hypothetical protein
METTILLNRNRASRLLGLNRDELDRLISRGHLRIVLINGKPLVHRDELSRFVHNLVG